jgi:hypothetical protein
VDSHGLGPKHLKLSHQGEPCVMHVLVTGVNKCPVVLTEGRAKSSANVHWHSGRCTSEWLCRILWQNMNQSCPKTTVAGKVLQTVNRNWVDSHMLPLSKVMSAWNTLSREWSSNTNDIATSEWEEEWSHTTDTFWPLSINDMMTANKKINFITENQPAIFTL